MKIILASNSPRRKELLKMCNIDFEVKVENIDEKTIEEKVTSENPNLKTYALSELITKSLAESKAKTVYNKLSDNCIVIGSDTVVACEERILGKPLNYNDAYNTLRYLCGKKHRVYTAVSIIVGDKIDTFCEYTEVEFYKYDEVTEKIIREYLESKTPFDKAGSYGIQDYGSLLVKNISGDYYTVVGFPISLVYRKIQQYINI